MSDTCTLCSGTGEITDDHGSDDRGPRVTVGACPRCGGYHPISLHERHDRMLRQAEFLRQRILAGRPIDQDTRKAISDLYGLIVTQEAHRLGYVR